jgi:hypothetical protein
LGQIFATREDGIQYATARVNQLEGIVTRNPQDFTVETPRILLPTGLIQALNGST